MGQEQKGFSVLRMRVAHNRATDVLYGLRRLTGARVTASLEGTQQEIEAQGRCGGPGHECMATVFERAAGSNTTATVSKCARCYKDKPRPKR